MTNTSKVDTVGGDTDPTVAVYGPFALLSYKDQPDSWFLMYRSEDDEPDAWDKLIAAERDFARADLCEEDWLDIDGLNLVVQRYASSRPKLRVLG